MARDNFTREVKDRLAKRVGMRCSNPTCRAPTSGPDFQHGVTNTGVAAHICAASPGGPRFEDGQTSEERSSFSNGIWLCQICAKLIDDDELRYPKATLLSWRDTSEKIAALEVQGFQVRLANRFTEMERKIPSLIAEMRDDLVGTPITRQFILFSRQWSYGGQNGPYFVYYFEDHEGLEAMVTIMEHYGAAYDVAFNDVHRFNFSEEFVDYILGH